MKLTRPRDAVMLIALDSHSCRLTSFLDIWPKVLSWSESYCLQAVNCSV